MEIMLISLRYRMEGGRTYETTENHKQRHLRYRGKCRGPGLQRRLFGRSVSSYEPSLRPGQAAERGMSERRRDQYAVARRRAPKAAARKQMRCELINAAQPRYDNAR